MRRRTYLDRNSLREMAEHALRRTPGFSPSLRIDGKLTRLGDGLSHETYLFSVDGDYTPSHKPMQLVLRRGRLARAKSHTPDESHDPAVEAAALRELEQFDLGFEVPRFICFADNTADHGGMMIETALPGVSFEFITAGKAGAAKFIEACAGIAAEIHRIPLAKFTFLPCFADSRAHALATLAQCDAAAVAQDDIAAEAASLIRAHAAAARPPALLHGDLLPQNVLRMIEPAGIGVVDWECARIGDPAYDLASVTRGNQKLLGLNNGRQKLVSAYRHAGGAAISSRDVMMWELLLVLRWFCNAVDQARRRIHQGQSPDYYSRQLRAILSRGATDDHPVSD